MNNGNGKAHDDYPDLMAEGFHELDPSLLVVRPPKIRWGELYKAWPVEKRLAHAEKLAAAMNHAAALIQDERDRLARLCELKEKRIRSLEGSVEQGNELLQGELVKMNADRQKWNQAAAAMKARIRTLEELVDGDHD